MDCTKDTLKISSIKYFENFSNKDLTSLKKAFSSKISLRDWEIEKNGLESVIETISNIFENNNSIIIKPINLLREGNQVCAEIEISINNTVLLRVVDIIKFNEQGKISSITAYKR